MNYYYPQVQGGYRFNMVERIEQEVGVRPDTTCDESFNDEVRTTITFAEPLTDEQKGLLDTLMSGNPTQPPATAHSVFKIWDIYERLADFNVATGIEFRIFYSELTPDSGIINQIELHAPRVLTEAERQKVLNAWGDIIK